MSDESEPGEATADAASTDGRDEIEAALSEVRRECRKVAFVYASLDAACVLLAVYFAAGVVGLPVASAEVAPAAFDSLGLPGPDAGALAGVVAGLTTFAAEFVVRTRRPAVEQFEAVNPEVREALRTARDAASADRSNPMTRALYADVLDRLRETSSVALLDATRLGVTVVLAFALSLATVQTAVVGVDLGVAGPEAGSSGPGGPTGSGDEAAFQNQTPELRSGDEVLGDPTDVSAGSENLSAAVDASSGGDGQREWDYDAGDGDGTDGDADAQRAGFAEPERVEDAALVQRYAHQLEANSTDD